MILQSAGFMVAKGEISKGPGKANQVNSYGKGNKKLHDQSF